MIAAPFLSEPDPLEKGEGSIDPLGLAPTYERLANRMLPAVTVRMGRVRFVTAMAVGAAVAEAWEVDAVAKDGVTSPAQVFEWAVVMSFVRRWDSLKDGVGIPGIQKVRRALDRGQAVSPATYLSVPSVFGFSGVFRRLARHLRVLDSNDRLGENGVVLLQAWCEDQDLRGFHGGAANDPGGELRAELTRVVADGMKTASLLDVPSKLAAPVAEKLDPGGMGGLERACLLRLLLERAGPPASVQALIDALKQRGTELSPIDEAGFLRDLAPIAPAELRELLAAIDDFESLCRPITDAFDRMRWLATAGKGGALVPEVFAAAPIIAPLLPAIAAGVQRMDARRNEFAGDPVVPALVDQYRGIDSPRRLYDALLDHHRRVQRAKPPSGKRPWFDEAANGGVFVRAAYSLEGWPENRWPYVHEYRLPTLSGFLSDLGVLK